MAGAGDGFLLLHVLVAALLAPTGEVVSLKLVRVSVPQYKVRGDMALLECQFDLDGDKLYSVKWYKDNEEFYRYVPRSETIKQSWKLEGVRVEHHLSSDKQVALKSVTLKSSGVYRCEVSAERPNFSSAEGEGRMEVVFLPKDGPLITGQEKQQYQVGDEINLNCTSGKSYPASELQWFINEEQVNSPDALVSYPHVTHPHGLLVSTLGLRLTVTGNHFLGGNMKVRCVASVSPILWQGDRESVVQRVSPLLEKNIREALIFVKGSSSQSSASLLIVTVMTSFVLSTVT